MNKEELELRHNLLETDVRVKSGDLEYANTALAKVKKELADINKELADITKPKITEEQSVELATQLCGVFNSAINEIQPDQLDIEFSVDWNRTIVVDCINGLGDIWAPEDEIHEVIASIFNVTIED